eukprot:contig_25886_g6382
MYSSAASPGFSGLFATHRTHTEARKQGQLLLLCCMIETTRGPGQRPFKWASNPHTDEPHLICTRAVTHGE